MSLSETSLGAYYSRRGADLVAIAEGRKASEQRDALAAELQNALAKQRLSAIECDSLRDERDALRDELTLRDERDSLRDERDALQRERDALQRERDALQRKRDAAQRQTLESGERIAKLDSDVEHLKVTRFEAKRECHSMKTSLSWRLTWPLRILRDKSAAILNQLKRSGNLSLTAQMHISSKDEDAIAAAESAESKADSVKEVTPAVGVTPLTLPVFDTQPIVPSAGQTRSPRGDGRRLICVSHVMPYPATGWQRIPHTPHADLVGPAELGHSARGLPSTQRDVERTPAHARPPGFTRISSSVSVMAGCSTDWPTAARC